MHAASTQHAESSISDFSLVRRVHTIRFYHTHLVRARNSLLAISAYLSSPCSLSSLSLPWATHPAAVAALPRRLYASRSRATPVRLTLGLSTGPPSRHRCAAPFVMRLLGASPRSSSCLRQRPNASRRRHLVSLSRSPHVPLAHLWRLMPQPLLRAAVLLSPFAGQRQSHPS